MIERLTIAVCASLLLMGCGTDNKNDTPNDQTKQRRLDDAAASKEADMDEDVVRQPNNPAKREGVKVYRPKKLQNVRYNRGDRTLIDLDTGDELVISSPGHAGGPGQFGFSNERTGSIAGGSVIYWSDVGIGVYEITAIRRTVDGKRQYRSREEYDIGRLAELFRAKYDQNDPSHRREILVVDSRPEKISEIDPQNGIRKAAQ